MLSVREIYLSPHPHPDWKHLRITNLTSLGEVITSSEPDSLSSNPGSSTYYLVFKQVMKLACAFLSHLKMLIILEWQGLFNIRFGSPDESLASGKHHVGNSYQLTLNIQTLCSILSPIRYHRPRPFTLYREEGFVITDLGSSFHLYKI